MGVHPGHYFEAAIVQPGVTIRGITPDSLRVWVRASEKYGPFYIEPGEEEVVIENMQIWGGSNWAVFNESPVLIQRCFLSALENEYEYYSQLDRTSVSEEDGVVTRFPGSDTEFPKEG